jgi:hypothetical protein
MKNYTRALPVITLNAIFFFWIVMHCCHRGGMGTRCGPAAKIWTEEAGAERM